jgi:hypothetical protein
MGDNFAQLGGLLDASSVESFSHRRDYFRHESSGLHECMN